MNHKHQTTTTFTTSARATLGVVLPETYKRNNPYTRDNTHLVRFKLAQLCTFDMG